MSPVQTDPAAPVFGRISGFFADRIAGASAT